MVISGTTPSSRMPTVSGVARQARPTPARIAPRPVRIAAPAYSGDPATIRSRPKVPLWARGGRSGSRSATQRWVSPPTAIASGSRAEVRHRHRDRHPPLVGDRDRHVLQAKRGRPCCRAPVEPYLWRPCPVGQDLDLPPADAPHAEAEHLADRLLGRPAAGDPLDLAAAIARLGVGQDACPKPIREATKQRDDSIDVDQVDP